MELKTRKGESFFIDDGDYGKIKHITWHVDSRGYVSGRDKINRKLIRLHRLILDAPSDKVVDHIDHNPLNNSRNNIRLCNRAENNRNRTPKGWSKYLGVTFRVRKNKISIKAQIKLGGKCISLGTHKTEEAAAHAYDKMAKEHYGEFANLNFKDGLNQLSTHKTDMSKEQKQFGRKLLPSGEAKVKKPLFFKEGDINLLGWETVKAIGEKAVADEADRVRAKKKR